MEFLLYMKHIDKDSYFTRSYTWFLVVLIGMTLPLAILGQEPVHNYGNLKIHDDGAVGFHDDFINDGVSDDNKGLAGFYNTDSSLISGAFRPIFQDLEVMVTNDLFLDVGVGVTNNTNFVVGNVFTPRNLLDINLDYIRDAFYTGETDNTKVDGYAASTNKGNFIFPIGDGPKLRPLELFVDASTSEAKSAYFFEDPNTPSTFPLQFDTTMRTDILTAVSTYEFWDLNSESPARIKLSWDTDSNLSTFVDAIENLRIVGWNTQDGLWENLGGNSITGDFNNGALTSDLFTPDNYSAITFGSSLSTDNIDLGNYLVTPNNDGINDVLYFDAVALSPNNELSIFNRWGRQVYYAKNYENTFDGNANQNFVVVANKKLPDGIYFYILTLKDIGVKHQGFLSLNQ